MSKIDVLLSCLHMRAYNPAPNEGDEVWCFRCTKYVYVGLVIADAYMAKCWDCSWKRSYGMDKYNADRAVKRHNINTGHESYLGRAVIRRENV